MWDYRAACTNVVDGDTYDLVIDTGFRTERTERVRLLGVNAPEMHGDAAEAGHAAREFADQWFEAAVKLAGAGWKWPLIVTTTKTDDFGRYLAEIVRAGDGASLAEALLAAGHAVPYKK